MLKNKNKTKLLDFFFQSPNNSRDKQVSYSFKSFLSAKKKVSLYKKSYHKFCRRKENRSYCRQKNRLFLNIPSTYPFILKVPPRTIFQTAAQGLWVSITLLNVRNLELQIRRKYQKRRVLSAKKNQADDLDVRMQDCVGW